jgi:hypothetical protein
MKRNHWEKMWCPQCGSDRTTIFPNRGAELLLIGLTGLRKYRCAQCGHCFRGADRRRFARKKSRSQPVVRRIVN